MIRMELGPVFFFAGLPIGLWLGWLISVGGALATIVSIGLLAAVVGFVARTLYVVRSSRDRAFKARILAPEKDGAVTESPYALTPYIKEKAEREGWGILDLGGKYLLHSSPCDVARIVLVEKVHMLISTRLFVLQSTWRA